MLRTLTALRFPAALAVFLYHAPLTRPAALELSAGYSGVGFFFLLSGFILTYNYAGGLTLHRYYAARFARIYPVHLTAMLVAIAALLVAGGGPEWNNASWNERAAAIALQVPLLQSWFSSAHIHFSANGPAWSLSCEEFFYALFPLALVAIARAFGRTAWRTILLAAAALWALYAATLVGVPAPFDDWLLYVFPPVRFFDFFIGMLLGYAFIRRDERSSHGDGTLAEVAVLCALAVGVVACDYAPQSLRFSAAMMPFSAAAIFVFALGRGAISRALAAKPFVRLGEASYAFYLLHRPIIELTWHAGASYPGLSFCFALLVSVAVSLAIFAYVETPLRRRIREAAAAIFAPAVPAAQ